LENGSTKRIFLSRKKDTLGQGSKERNRKDITNRLFLMKSSTKKRAAILENAGRGKFKLCSKQG